MNFRICIVFSFLLVMGCSKKLELKLPSESPRLVIKSLSRQGSVFALDVFRTQELKNIDSFVNADFTVTDATGILSADGVVVDTLTYSSSRRTYAAKRNTTVVQGKNYTLTISAPQLGSATSATTLPTRVPILQSGIIRGLPHPGFDEIRFRFSDPVGETNYYRFFIRYPSSVSGSPPRAVYSTAGCLYTNDPSLVTNNSSSNPFDPSSCIGASRWMFTDAVWGGTNKEMVLRVDTAFTKSMFNPVSGVQYRPYIELWSITESYYKYLVNIALFNEYDNTPFSEPVITYTNVKDGYGIFAAYHSVVDTLR